MGEKLKVGEIVFFSTSNNTVAGEAMFIGRSKASPDDLVLVSGKQVFEMWETYCTPMKRGLPAEGESWRRQYLKQNPGSLLPSQ
jgi:hypothetical protein